MRIATLSLIAAAVLITSGCSTDKPAKPFVVSTNSVPGEADPNTRTLILHLPTLDYAKPSDTNTFGPPPQGR